ncbi:MAG: M23 family metallopeptidase [Bacteroidota bacterium]
MKKKIFHVLKWSFAILFVIGLLLPQDLMIPVQGANQRDWNSETFWYDPWGSSITHKGVDIFAQKGTPVISGSHGIKLFKFSGSKGGNGVLILGPKWRLHYYAHFQEYADDLGVFIPKGKIIGYVGTTGNAMGKPAHLHYSLATLIPYPWRIDGDRQGWMKMFILNPLDYLEK